MKAEFTFFVMTSSSEMGAAKDWNLKPGFEGWRVEEGNFEACTTWMILWGEGWLAEDVEDTSWR